MNSANRDNFPSQRFLKKYYGWNMPLFGWLDTGIFRSSKYKEIRREFQYILLSIPHHTIKAEDRDFNGTREVYIFQDHKFSDWTRNVLAARLASTTFPEGFERDLFDELSAFVISHQPFTKDWWEWFAEDGNLGVRFTKDAKDGGNEPLRTLDQMLSQE